MSAFGKVVRRLIYLSAAIVATGIAQYPAAAAAADRTDSITVSGVVRTFILHLPDRIPAGARVPVILAFHGGGMQGNGMRRLTSLDAVADKRGFLVVYPDGIDKHWNDGRLTIRNPQDDVGFVSALIDRLEKNYPVDQRRIYATGISNGALFAERLGCDLSERVAGIAPIAGTLPGHIAPTCQPRRPVAVMQVDGTEDPVMPFAGGKVADFGGKGEGGVVLSVATTTRAWATFNHCGPQGVTRTLPPIAPADQTRIIETRYIGCPGLGAVTLLTVVGGGHTWPGGPQYVSPAIVGSASRQIDASNAIADFFLSLPPRAG